MQETLPAGAGTQSRLPNPLLDIAIACLEAQLKAWQAYQVEGTLFVARRLRSNLEHMRAIGHCCDIESTGQCQRAWLHDIQKDYAEECGRVAATTFALAFGELSGFGLLFGQRVRKTPGESQPTTQPAPGPKSGFQAAA